MPTATPILALALVAPAPLGPRATPPEPEPAPQPDALEPEVPQPQELEPIERPSIMLDEDYVPPFPSEPLALSQVLEESAGTNFELALMADDIKIAEATVLQALGAFDVFLTAGLTGTASETPQRGSQIVFALAQRTLTGSVGLLRRLETGGEIRFDFNAGRVQTLQPVNFFDADAGSIWLSEYRIIPSLTLTHPLLQGAGLRVNRADINRAKIATSQAEAARLSAAQDLARDIISAYWDVLFAHRDLENRRRSVELAARQLERTRALVAAGRLSPVDAKTVEQGLAQRESEVLSAENALLDTSLTLRTLMGQEFADRDLLGVLPATDPVVRPRHVVPRDEIQRALQVNPQVRQIELAIASRRIDELVAANARLPRLDAAATFTPQGRSVTFRPDLQTGDPGQSATWGEAFRNFFPEDVRQDGLLADWTLTGSLTLTWDIQNRGPKGMHERAKAEIRSAETQLKQIRQQVAAGVIRAANGLRITGKQIEVSELALDLALENLEAEQARFEVGRATSYNVLERLDEVDLAAATALSAQVQYLKTLVQLQALTGEILPAYGLSP